MKKIIGVRFLLGLLLVWLLSFSASSASAGETVRAVRWAGAINPVAGSFIGEQIAKANQGDKAFLLEIDTPGGLDSSMRDIIQAELGSHVPVIVYVSPAGARAASAGALIALAADFAAMAPGTNLGAAHPVSIGASAGEKEDKDSVMMTKVLNDAVAYSRSIAAQRGRSQDWAEQIVKESISTSAGDALELGIVDLLADSPEKLLVGLTGKTYRRSGKELVFSGEGLELVYVEMNTRDSILNILSDPNIAYMLLMLGVLGIFFELSQPGVVFPGAIGAIALLLAFFGLQTLPVNFVGVLLILLGVVLFILEIKVASYGMLSVGGVLSLSLGSLMLIATDEPSMQISRTVIAAVVFAFSGLFMLVFYFVMRTQKTSFVSGREGMVGEQGVACGSIQTVGRVFVHGEYWDAVSTQPVADGDRILIVRVLPGMRVEVEALPGQSNDLKEGE